MNIEAHKSLKNGFAICLCDSYSLSPLYRSTSNQNKDSAARRPRSTTLTAAYMTAQITNATPYMIASKNGDNIYVSNVRFDLSWVIRLLRFSIPVFTKNIGTKH
jgi:hypothetical protein